MGRQKRVKLKKILRKKKLQQNYQKKPQTNKPTKKGHKTQKPHRNTTHMHKKTPPTITTQMHDNINNTPSVCLQILTWDEC